MYHMSKCTCNHIVNWKFFTGMWMSKVCSFTNVMILGATSIILISKGTQEGLTWMTITYQSEPGSPLDFILI